jgi:hypothetical protein
LRISAFYENGRVILDNTSERRRLRLISKGVEMAVVAGL